jgi:hypothetical protein
MLHRVSHFPEFGEQSNHNTLTPAFSRIPVATDLAFVSHTAGTFA